MMLKKWWVPVFAAVIFALEGLFAELFPVELLPGSWHIVPRFLFLYLLFHAVYYDEKSGILYAALFGFLTDLVFSGIWGIYLFWYPAILLLVTKVMKVLHAHLAIMAIVSLFSISVLEFGVYGIYSLLRFTQLGMKLFVEWRLVPTLLFNMVLYALSAYPMKKWFLLLRMVKEEEEGMFQS
jgi:rod shape-determining protein MreD